MYAKVIVDIKTEELNHSFDYLIPAQFEGFLERGMRVIVPFGAQTRLGYVIEIIEKSNDATKEILEVLDAVPVVDDEAFTLMDSMMESAPNLQSAVFEAVIPSELLISYHKEVHLLDSKNIIQNALNLSPAERLFIIETLSKSLSEPDKEIERYWKEEVEKRYEAFINGKYKSIPYEEIVKK